MKTIAFAAVGLLSLNLLAPISADAQYTAIVLPSPSDASEAFGHGISGNFRVGFYDVVSPFSQQALVWTGNVNSPVNLTPSGFADSFAYGVSGNSEIGYGTLPGSTGATHALLWSGTAASAVDLNPAGFSGSVAYAVLGNSQVGNGAGSATNFQADALMWNGSAASYVDLAPSFGYESSTANALSATNEVGFAVPTQFSGQPQTNPHAMVWSGTAAGAVDLNPQGFNYSEATGVSGNVQVGFGATNYVGGLPTNYTAMLWHGTAQSYVSLNPAGFSSAEVLAMSGNTEVGFGSGTATLGQQHALLWNSSATSYVDLQSFLPPSFTQSTATGIDSNGDIIGYGTNGAGADVAIVWTAAPEPSTLILAALGAFALLAYRRRQG